MVLAQGIDLIFGFTAFRTEKPEKVKCEGVQSQCAPKNQSPQFESGDLHGPFHIRKALPSALTGSGVYSMADPFPMGYHFLPVVRF
jgi:hypothetical protein